MDYSKYTDMLHKDAITAGYSLVTSTMRKAASKVLGDKGVGSAGINALSLAAGVGLSQVNNPHVKIIGSALRISGIAGFGNSMIEKIVNRNKDTENK